MMNFAKECLFNYCQSVKHQDCDHVMSRYFSYPPYGYCCTTCKKTFFTTWEMFKTDHSSHWSPFESGNSKKNFIKKIRLSSHTEVIAPKLPSLTIDVIQPSLVIGCMDESDIKDVQFPKSIACQTSPINISYDDLIEDDEGIRINFKLPSPLISPYSISDSDSDSYYPGSPPFPTPAYRPWKYSLQYMGGGEYSERGSVYKLVQLELQIETICKKEMALKYPKAAKSDPRLQFEATFV